MKRQLIAAAIGLGLIFGGGALALPGPSAEAATTSQSWQVPYASLCPVSRGWSISGITVAYAFTPTGPGSVGTCTKTVTF